MTSAFDFFDLLDRLQQETDLAQFREWPNRFGFEVLGQAIARPSLVTLMDCRFQGWDARGTIIIIADPRSWSAFVVEEGISPLTPEGARFRGVQPTVVPSKTSDKGIAHVYDVDGKQFTATAKLPAVAVEMIACEPRPRRS